MDDEIHMPGGFSAMDSNHNDPTDDDSANESDFSLEQVLDGAAATASNAHEDESMFDDEDMPLDMMDRQGDSGQDDPPYSSDIAEMNSDGTGSAAPSSSASSSASRSPRLRPIEVVLSPPIDPDSYQHIPFSPMVRVGNADDSFEAEFVDGDIKDPSYGSPRNPSKRPRSEDAYEESGSEFEAHSKRRKPRTVPNARHTRRNSGQASDPDLEDSEFDDESKSQLIDLAESQSDEEIIRRVPNGRHAASLSRKGRLTRSRNFSNRKRVTAIGSDDELAQDRHKSEESDYWPVVRSDLAPEPQVSKRRKGRGRQSKIADSDASAGFEARRSSRANKNLKSMKDPELEDVEAVEDKQISTPRHAVVKETFQPLPLDAHFRGVHSRTCQSCLADSDVATNPLIFCQGCSFSYHKVCLSSRSVRDHRVTKIDHESFVLQCRFCIQHQKKQDPRIPNHTVCQVCKESGPSCAEFSSKKTTKQEEKARAENEGNDPITTVNPSLINNADNILFRCTDCKRAYHFGHLPVLGENPITNQRQGLKESRLEEYANAGWSCKDCTNTKYKINALVAWRPLDQASYVSGQTNEDYGEDSIEYLVNWTGRSHFHDTWMRGAWIYGVAPATMRLAFHKRESTTYPKMDKSTAIEEEWLLPDVLLRVKYGTRVTASDKAEDLERIDDIVSVFVKFQGLGYEDAVWDEPPPQDSGAPWEAFVAAYDEYLNGKYFASVSSYKIRERISQYRSLDFGKHCELKSQPAQLKKGKLMGYQIEGVNFLLYNFHQQQNVILADEMGLGKTIQIVAFMSALALSSPGCWPFLVVVPNATCPNWRREIKQWSPDLRVVTYHGGKVSQDLAYKHELYPDGRAGGMKAHVVIMSYDSAATLNNVFQGVKWVGLIVDEGQRLKNEETLLYKALQDMKISCRILLTGTPLQNNKRELFNLLQFIDAQRNAEELDAKYSELTKENIPELHNLIRPYFLRRTKAQVLKFLPPMAQIILPVTMTVVQEKLSKSIMARNPDLIRAIISKSRVKAGERKSMNNILLDLRQCLCHPFCFNGEIEDRTVDSAQMHRNLVEASPKLLLLELMLPKLEERGHRVLIFSQFLHSLTILEDFLTGLDLVHSRIDGTVSALEKQKRIDAFNAPDSPLFAMLLSTRAGGVGINLATADTVIIYDPDFNPHQDIQALSRAHRIGQKHKVLCFQLMTKNTVEEKIMQIGRKKMVLDHALIERMDANQEASEDLESILKHGAAALFGEEDKDKIIYDDASVDKLLDRSQIENTDTGQDKSAESQFSFARIWATDKGEMASNTDESDRNVSPDASTSIWENILKEREAAHQREVAARQQVYGRGARRRGTEKISYKPSRIHEVGSGSEIDVDDEYIDHHEMEDEVDEGDHSEGESDDGTGSEKPSDSDGAKAVKGTGNNIPQHPLQGAVVVPSSSAIAMPRPPGNFRSTLHPNTHLPQLTSSPATQPQGPYAQPRIPLPVPAPIPVRSVLPPQPIPMQYPIIIEHPAPMQPPVSARPRMPVQHPLPAHRPMAVQLPNGEVAPQGLIGGGNPCALCSCQHSLRNPCVDLNSEHSLRIALDRLRIGDERAAQAARSFFLIRLQIVLARNPRRQ